MKTILLRIVVLINAAIGLPAGNLYAQTTMEDLAKRLVNTTISIQPGELVTITGDPDQIPLMENIAVEVITWPKRN